MKRTFLLPAFAAALGMTAFAQTPQTPSQQLPASDGCTFIAEDPLETIVYECIAPVRETNPVAGISPRYVPGPVYHSSDPGPVVAASLDPSQLPLKAIRFINKHFAGKKIVECEREFSTNTLEVGFADGTDVEFTADGEWMEVEAGHRHVIAEHLLNVLLPEQALRELRDRHVIGRVDSVKRDSRGFKIELRDVALDDVRFSPEGRLLSVNG